MTRFKTKHIGSGALTAVAVSALITLSVLALSIPGSALSSSDERPVLDTSATAAPSSAPSTTSSLLSALAHEPLKRDFLDITFDFTDWAALKVPHGGASITLSAAPAVTATSIVTKTR